MLNYRKTAIFLIIILLFSSFSISILADDTTDMTNVEDEGEKFKEDIDFLKMVIDFVLDKYLYDVSYDDIINGIYDGFFSVLDDYSVHYTPEEYKSFSTSISGEFSGIGVQIVERNNQIVVVTALPSTPAIEAGIKPNDIIFSVDDIDITGYTTEDAAKLIRGEIGSSVKLGIKRDGNILYFDIIRNTVVISSVSSDILENNIGYLKITQFNNNTCELVKKELQFFKENKISDIVIDLRNNPGGSLDEVVDILNLFVPEGPLVYIEKANGEEEILKSDLESPNYNISVIVNKGSASASEIFAGAVQDRNAGKIIGTITYGKGVVQSMFPLKDGHAIKFTTSEYLTAGKNKVHGIGITPDIIVENIVGEPIIDLSDFPKLKKTRKPNVGIVGLDVLGAEMILNTLGYQVSEPDGIFDEITFEQIKQFQVDNGLYGYGVLDFSTQDALTRAINEYANPEVKDLQLEEAINALN